MKEFFKKMHAGIIAVEAVIGVSLAGLILVYSVYAINTYVNSGRDIAEKTQALYLAEDGLELIRYVRDNAWTKISSIPLNQTRYLETTNTGVSISVTPEILDGYTRSFTLDNVYREPGTYDIVASTTAGSVADTDSKYVTMTVRWGTPVKSVSLTTIIADIAP